MTWPEWTSPDGRIACIRTDRRCIAIEKEEKYWRIGIERCKREYARTALFDHMEAGVT